MEMKDYNLTCGEVIDNLLMLADAYEKASAGKAPNGFAFNPTDAAANMKAAVHFIGSFGQQLPRWIPVEERLPDEGEVVLAYLPKQADVESGVYAAMLSKLQTLKGTFSTSFGFGFEATHWMPLPEPPDEAT